MNQQYDSKLSFNLKEPDSALLHLPNELLLHILTDDTILSPRDLYTIALVCRHFHFLALPLFLAAHGISNPTSSTSMYVTDWNPVHLGIREPDVLAGLSIATHITTIKHLRCFYQDRDGKSARNTFQQAAHLPHAIRRTARFVSNLSSVEKAEIDLVRYPYYVAQTLNGAVPVPEIRDWALAFESLLNSIVERGCRELTVQYDAAIEAGFRFRERGKVMKKALAFVSQTVHRGDGLGRTSAESSTAPELQWDWKRPRNEFIQKAPASETSVDPAVLSCIAEERLTLVSLSIHSPVLLLPPFTNWTLSLLHTHTCLTHLSFAYISFSKELWSFLLPFIADATCYRLTELSVLRNCPHLAATDLLRFLTRLPRLRTLVVDRTFRSRFQAIRPVRGFFSSSSSNAPPSIPSNLPLPFFPHLHMLQAPVELVSLLFDARPPSTNSTSRNAVNSAGTALPELKSLIVYPTSLLIHPPSYVESTLVVNALHRRVLSILHDRDDSLDHKPTIEFSLNAEKEFTDFGPVVRYFETLSTRQGFQRMLWDSLSFSAAEVEQLGLMEIGLAAGIPNSNHSHPNSNSSNRSPISSARLTSDGLYRPEIEFAHVTHLVLHKFDLSSKDHPEDHYNDNDRTLCRCAGT